VREAAEEASKELTGKEKQEVQLQERLKHANGKAKKLKKQLTEVFNYFLVVKNILNNLVGQILEEAG